MECAIDFESLKQRVEIPPFDAGPTFSEPKIRPEQYWPAQPSGFGRFLPGAKRRYEEENRLAEEQYYKDVAAQQSRLADHQRSLQARRAAYDQHVAEVQRQAAEQHAEIDTFTGGFIASDPGAIVEYFTLVLQRSRYPDGFLQQAKVAYIAESRQLLVEYDFPLLNVVPEVSAYRYIKAKNEIASTP